MPLCPDCRDEAVVSTAELGEYDESQTDTCSRCGEEF